MIASHWVSLISSLLGAAGTALLFFFSHTDEPYQAGVFGSDAVTEFNERLKVKNKVWRKRQQIGFGLLCVSFLVQAAAAFMP